MDKKEQKRHLLVLPYQGGKGSCFINPYKRDWRSFCSLRVIRNFGDEDRQFCETIFAKHSTLDVCQVSEYASNEYTVL